jgi:hypothetical protein
MTTDPATTPDAERGNAGGADERSAEERAEQIVERVTEDVTRYARRLVGRLREEIEDIVAEGRTIARGGDRPG